MLSSRTFLLNDNLRDDDTEDRRFFFQIPFKRFIKLCRANYSYGLFCCPNKNGRWISKAITSKSLIR